MQGSGFDEVGYVVLPNLVAAATARLCAGYALANRLLPGYYVSEPEFTAWGRYADALGEVVLAQSREAVEAATGQALFPAYSYLRIYGSQAELPRHTDRPSCEFSVTLTLGGESPAPWPIWIEGQAGAHAVTLAPGDALIYRGAVLPHWRERFDGRFWVQLFLHYVARDGEFASCRFDGRSRLGPLIRGGDPRRENFKRRFEADDPCPCGSGRLYGECHGTQRAP